MASGRDIVALIERIGLCKPGVTEVRDYAHLTPKEMWDQYDNGQHMIEYCKAIGVPMSHTMKALSFFKKMPRATWANIVRSQIPYEIVRQCRKEYMDKHEDL